MNFSLLHNLYKKFSLHLKLTNTGNGVLVFIAEKLFIGIFDRGTNF